MVEERELLRNTVRTCIMQKRVSFAFFKQWYWDCFDEDVQVSLPWHLHTTLSPAARSLCMDARACSSTGVGLMVACVTYFHADFECCSCRSCIGS